VSDEEGRFDFAGLESSLCTIQVTPPPSSESKLMMTRVESVEPGDADLEIVLPEGRIVSGRVVNGNDEPIGVAMVQAFDEDGKGAGRDLSKPDGSFRILTASKGALRLDVRVHDPGHPIPLMQQPVVATLEDVDVAGPPVTIVVEDR
jgi:hypothetical protein